MLKGKKIILGISGGIAAYKCGELIRLMIKEGVEVRCVITANAKQFITPLTLQTLSKNKVYCDEFELVDTWNPEHVSHNTWADAMIVAPATANIIAKFACGIADDALSTTFVAFDKPVFIAPAMNDKMYASPVVTRNIEYLKSIGVRFVEPGYGELACGVVGKGRMEEPEKIVEYLKNNL